MAVSKDPVDLAWAAAFIEGEGSICTFRQHSQRNIRVTMRCSNTDKPYIVRLHSILGGLMNERVRRDDYSRPKVSWLWALNKKAEVEEALVALMPHLTEGGHDKERARIALETLTGGET